MPMTTVRRILSATLGLGPAGALIGFVLAGPAWAQSPNPVPGDPVAQVEHRQENMKRLGDSMKAVRRYVANEGGTIAEVQKGARTIQEVSRIIVPQLFPAGTEIGVSDSDARPEIWQQWPRFTEITETLQQESAKLVEVSQTDDRATVAAQFAAVGRACSSCHDDFRREKPKQ